ncbi:hypothetical protein [Nonomuraea sp. NPDC049695]|uniref:hypothetical protein n=1 Tax=Nonomuraea sp. NPDC049695 TaxID=3154734 RepID=UPI0034410E55
MRLWALALTITLVAAIVPPSAPAEARLDPVAALRVQLESGNGVTFSSVTIFTAWDGKPRTTRRSGVHELAHGGIIASELLDPEDGKDPEHFIIFPDRYYEQSSFWRKRLPEGKSWGVVKDKQSFTLTCGDIRLTNPATLKALLAGTKARHPAGVYDGTRTTLHEGIITLGEIAMVDPDLRIGTSRPTGAYAQVRINWKLWIGQDQLVRRCHSSSWYPGFLGADDLDPYQLVDDVRLSRWGRPTDIKPPAPDQVATSDEINLPGEAPVAPR